MAETTAKEPNRRDFLYVATGAMAAVGAASLVWPFVAQLQPDASVQALATLDVDLSQISEGQSITVMWQGKPVFVRHRTAAEIEAAEDVDLRTLPDPEADSDRVERAEWLVVVGVCTHLGCVPIGNQGDYADGGWFCPCHGSHYDQSGRIRSGPAPLNLEVPPYEFTSDTSILIG